MSERKVYKSPQIREVVCELQDAFLKTLSRLRSRYIIKSKIDGLTEHETDKLEYLTKIMEDYLNDNSFHRAYLEKTEELHVQSEDLDKKITDMLNKINPSE